MPLLDHFHPPLFTERHWEHFHARWSGAVSDSLNARLPPHYFAEQQTHVGSRVKIDVATYDYGLGQHATEEDHSEGGVATLVAEPEIEAPPQPLAAIPIIFPDRIEVLVYSTEAGPVLVGAIELVSPGNKDREESRQAFVAKCATYLHSGVGLMIIDIVTNRHANLHNQLLSFLGQPGVADLPENGLFASAYRPTRGPLEPPTSRGRAEVWAASIFVGSKLPSLHLPLDRRQFIPVDLEATYSEARGRSRLG